MISTVLSTRVVFLTFFEFISCNDQAVGSGQRIFTDMACHIFVKFRKNHIPGENVQMPLVVTKTGACPPWHWRMIAGLMSIDVSSCPQSHAALATCAFGSAWKTRVAH